MVIWHAIFRERCCHDDQPFFMELFRWYIEYSTHHNRYRMLCCARSRYVFTCLLARSLCGVLVWSGCYSVLFSVCSFACRSHFSRSLLTLCWISHSFAPNHRICVTVSFWHILTTCSRRLLLLSIFLRFAPIRSYISSTMTVGYSYIITHKLVLYIIASASS